MSKRYAEGTAVTVESSRGEITGILAKHGVSRMGWFSEPVGDILHFELGGYQYQFKIAKPTWKDVEDRFVYDRTPIQRQAAIDAEWRRRWRANVLLLKAKLEFAEGEASTVARELLPYALLKSGQTVEEAMQGDALPLLAAKAG